jgi:chromate transporter
VSWLMLYFVFLEGTATTFAGFTSLPVIREDLVIRRHVATDEQLDRAVAVARSTPGPMGLHVVSIGYQVAGWKGACAGWLAMIPPHSWCYRCCAGSAQRGGTDGSVRR